MRALVVVLAFLYALAFGIPTVLSLQGRYGSVGIARAPARPNADLNTVGAVAPGSAAARAGIVPGDVAVRAEAEHAPPFEQVIARLPAGRVIPYAVVHEGTRRVVGLTPVAVRPEPSASVPIVALLVRGVLIALIGAALVLLRPSIMTAAFAVLCLEFAEIGHPLGNFELTAALPLAWKPLSLALTCVVNGGGPAVAAIFLMRFPSGRPLPSWRPAERAMTVVGILMIALYAAALYAGGTASVLGSRLYGIFSVVVWLCYAVAAAAFMVRYLHASGEDRARLRWVAIGLGSFLVSYALFWYAENDAHAPAELSWRAQFVNVLPMTVLYAAVRHRVLDVRVAGGRAVAFAVFSAIPVVAFSLIDWALSNQLQSSKFALVAEVFIAVGFGFWVNASQRRIDNLIESLFFRARTLAANRLRRVARRLAHATESGAVDETLVREPYEALQLGAIALYLHAEGRFVRAASLGWPDETLAEVGANDGLALELATGGETVDIKSIAWERESEAAALAPSLAVPIGIRHRTLGFLLVCEKRDREPFDELERTALQTLADAAATAYDHLEAEAQRRIAGDLRRALDDLSIENTTLRGLLSREASGS